jgi:hypothetical protein
VFKLAIGWSWGGSKCEACEDGKIILGEKPVVGGQPSIKGFRMVGSRQMRKEQRKHGKECSHGRLLAVADEMNQSVPRGVQSRHVPV